MGWCGEGQRIQYKTSKTWTGITFIHMSCSNIQTLNFDKPSPTRSKASTAQSRNMMTSEKRQYRKLSSNFMATALVHENLTKKHWQGHLETSPSLYFCDRCKWITQLNSRLTAKICPVLRSSSGPYRLENPKSAQHSWLMIHHALLNFESHLRPKKTDGSCYACANGSKHELNMLHVTYVAAQSTAAASTCPFLHAAKGRVFNRHWRPGFSCCMQWQDLLSDPTQNLESLCVDFQHALKHQMRFRSATWRASQKNCPASIRSY